MVSYAFTLMIRIDPIKTIGTSEIPVEYMSYALRTLPQKPVRERSVPSDCDRKWHSVPWELGDSLWHTSRGHRIRLTGYRVQPLNAYLVVTWFTPTWREPLT